MDLNSLLVWLATGGSVVAISYMVEQWGLFHSLTSLQKRFAMWSSASALGMGALWITQNVDPATLAMIAEYAKVMITTFSLIFLQEVFHANSKQRPMG